MSFVLVRHGETDSNRNRVVQVPETPLNEKGLAQAAAVGRRLAEELAGRPVRLIASDLERAAMTADAIARELSVDIETQPLLQERNFGDLRGRRYAEIGTDIMAPGYAPPGGETWETFDARVAQAWRAMRQLFDSPATIVAVSHGLVCRSLAHHHFSTVGLEVPDRWGNTSVTIVERAAPYRPSILNCTRHLDALTADAGQMSGI